MAERGREAPIWISPREVARLAKAALAALPKRRR
jgi:hypothetical protein